MKTIVGLCGSLRAASSNLTLLELARDLANERGIRLLIEGEIALLPHFNPDDESDPPEIVRAFRERIEAADALLLSTPEYAHGLPGAFKNALDWLVGCERFAGMPAAILNPSPHSRYASPQLAEILRTMSARLIPEEPVTIPKERLASEFDGVQSELDDILRHLLSAPSRHEAYDF